MTDAELLKQVKTGLNITSTYQDNTLSLYIDEVKNYMVDAGVSEDLINSDLSVGVITRGVSDLWNYGMGDADFSEHFKQRVIQLRYKDIPKSLGTLIVTSIAGTKFSTTHIDVIGQSIGAIFKYRVTPQKMDLPKYNEDLSNWTDWDGISDIFAEDGHYICIAEITSENKALSAGTTIITVYLE